VGGGDAGSGGEFGGGVGGGVMNDERAVTKHSVLLRGFKRSTVTTGD
jgi:hypothetical protein